MKILLPAFLLFLSFSVYAQQEPPACGSDVLLGQKRQNPAFVQQEEMMNIRIHEFINQNQNRGGVLTIPVVVHIIHNNGPENISDVQVQQGIQQLNDAFANSGPYQNIDGVNTHIQFCLAQQDPTGAPSTGINRVVSPLTNITIETQDGALKNLSRWDPTHYLNIWVVKEITSASVGPGVAGYANLPTSHGQPEDGIVVEAPFLGQSTNNTKVTVHEAGHYLGLYHTFEASCGNGVCYIYGDRVCDTPPDNSSAAAQCGQAPNTCHTEEEDPTAYNPFRAVGLGGLGDQPDMIENYMDYGYQSCQLWFTQGQADRMEAALTITRASLLTSPGCQPGCTSLVNLNFTASNNSVTSGNSLSFSVQNPNGNYVWYANGVQIGTGNSISHVFTGSGSVTITLTGSNNLPECTRNNEMVISVICSATAQFNLSSGPYTPGVTITATNTSTNATLYKWYLDGIQVSTSPNYVNQFNQGGGHNLYLIASNNACSDTSTTSFFNVGDCSLKGTTNNWYFTHYGLTFSTSPPTLSAGNNIVTDTYGQEATSVMSDVDGNLLFYSDGDTVWDKNHHPMPNGTGLMGGPSSTMNSLAVPYPGSTHLYYLFTAPQLEQGFLAGTRYNILDMDLNNGLGDIVTGQKNILLRDGTGEKLTATYHANGRDIWIAVDDKFGHNYYVYLITPAGINTTAITSTLSNVNVNGYGTAGLGGMKFSHDGNKIAIAHYYPPEGIMVCDFNKTTGVISNVLMLDPLNDDLPLARCFEFSPDNSKLYASMYSGLPQRLLQYDLAAGSPAQIAASEINIQTRPGFNPQGEICLGNDGRIYQAMCNPQRTQGMLDYVAYPNLAGVACGYTQVNVTYALFDLPNLMQGLQQPRALAISGVKQICAGNQSYTYTIPYFSAQDSIVWAYSGPGQFTANGDTAMLAVNTQTGPGTMVVAVYNHCGIMHDTLHIGVLNAGLNLGPDTVMCANSSFTLTAPASYDHYLWNNNDTTLSLLITQPGIYWLQVSNPACIGRDSVVVSPYPAITPVTITADPPGICTQNITILSAGNYAGYQWNSGFETNANYTAFQPGTYWVTVTDGCHFDTDSISIGQSTLSLQLVLGDDTTACKTQLPFTLTAPAGYTQYVWQNGSQNQSINITAIGNYWVTVTDGSGCTGTDTFRVEDCTGIVEDILNGFKIYPNPATDRLYIESNSNGLQTVKLYNVAGQLLSGTAFTGKTTLPITHLPAGVYIVELAGEKGVVRKKILIAD